jgi:RND family efflux transporter MFP subunit
MRYRNIIICFVLSILLSGCSKDPPVYSKTPPSVYQFPVTEVKVENIPVYYSTIGSVVSDTRIEISSRITGFINNITVHEGMRVHSGKLLIIIDNSDVEGAINQIKSSVAKCTGILIDAETDVERFNALFTHGCVSDNTLRKVLLQRDIARNNLDEAKASLQTAISQRKYTRIICPVNGVVVNRQKRAGDLATPGVPILTIESAQALLFDTYIPESYMANIGVGDEVSVDIDALEKSFKGNVARIVPSGDPASRSYQVKITIPVIDGLLPGMFGRAKFFISHHKSPVVKRTHICVRGGLTGVFLLDQDNSVKFRWLRIARQWQDNLEVSAGLTGGERIVAGHFPELREGDIVREAGVDER